MTPLSGIRWLRVLPPLLALGCALPAMAGANLSERLQDAELKRVRDDVRRHQERAAAPAARPEAGALLDVRCAMHVHSGLSHDSRGTAEEITAAARRAGVRAVFMSEHPTEDRRWATEGLRGEREGVLFIPGAELSDGLLIWNDPGTGWTPGMKVGEVLPRVSKDAVTVVSHAELRADDAWDLPPFTGLEIYNSHADAEDNSYEKLLADLQGNPLKLFTLLGTLKRYPQESYAAIFDEQTAIVRRWDTLNAANLESGRRMVGIAGNDAHQNVGLAVVAAEETLEVRDALGQVLREVPKKSVPAFLLGPLTPGATVLAHTFDPYDVALGYVSTHLLAEKVEPEALFTALRQGRAYVAFDWMADPTGFRYEARTGDARFEMGDTVTLASRPELKVTTPIPSDLRVLWNGAEVHRAAGSSAGYTPSEPGVYRVEARLRVAGQDRPWIYSNPIYVR
ncbi:MAG: hypothetical protein ACK47B_10500 [Armatimonadota bacterium]